MLGIADDKTIETYIGVFIDWAAPRNDSERGIRPAQMHVSLRSALCWDSRTRELSPLLWGLGDYVMISFSRDTEAVGERIRSRCLHRLFNRVDYRACLRSTLGYIRKYVVVAMYKLGETLPPASLPWVVAAPPSPSTPAPTQPRPRFSAPSMPTLPLPIIIMKDRKQSTSSITTSVQWHHQPRSISNEDFMSKCHRHLRA